MNRYKMIVYSNPVGDMEEEYREWYSGKHIHDMLNIPGFKGAQWYKMSEHQQIGTAADKKYRYVLIWDIEAEDIDDVWQAVIQARRESRITYSPAFDRATYCTVVEAVTDYVTFDQIIGMSAEEVRNVTNLVD